MSKYHPFYNLNAPMNSLRYKCLCKLASIMPPSSEADPILFSRITSALHGKMDVVQQIIDHISYEGRKKRIALKSVESLCALLITGGCYDLDLFDLLYKPSKKEITKIVDILVQNCDQLTYLRVDPIKGFPFKGKIMPNLEHVICTIRSLADPIAIFSTCPKLCILELKFVRFTPTDQELNIFFEAFEKLKYQSRMSLHTLCSGPLSGSILIKLVSLLPNLKLIVCNDVEQIFNTIHYYDHLHTNGRAPDNMNYQSLSSIGENISVSSAELRRAVEVLRQLTGIRADLPIKERTMDRIFNLMPNLESINLICYGDWFSYELAAVGDFRNLQTLVLDSEGQLVITAEMFLPVLKKIGHNLRCLKLIYYKGDISIIGQYCPNLDSLLLVSPNPPRLESFSPRKRLMREWKMVSREQLETLKRSFKFLVKLVLVNCDYHYVIAAILTNASNIKAIVFLNCEINDEQLKVLVENNYFSKLELLVIIGKHSVSQNYFNSLKNSLLNLNSSEYNCKEYM